VEEKEWCCKHGDGTSATAPVCGGDWAWRSLDAVRAATVLARGYCECGGDSCGRPVSHRIHAVRRSRHGVEGTAFDLRSTVGRGRVNPSRTGYVRNPDLGAAWTARRPIRDHPSAASR